MKVSELENKFANSINTEISLLDATLQYKSWGCIVNL